VFFIKKKEKIKVELYSPIGQLIDMFPPVLMQNDLPSWYNNIPNSNIKTVKHCPGLRDLYENGISVPLWTDYLIDIGEDTINNVDWPKRNPNSGIGKHDLSIQAPKAWPGYYNIKFESPWHVWCNEPIPFIFVQPVWNQGDPQQFTNVPGVTEFRNQHQLHINTLWKPSGVPQEVMLKAGTILSHLVPLSDRPVEISFHILTETIYKEKFSVWDYTLGRASYLKYKSIISKKKN